MILFQTEVLKFQSTPGNECVSKRSGYMLPGFLFNPFTARFSFQIKHKICKNMNSARQQCEHHHWKVLIESFHVSGHTFRFPWAVQDLEVFLGLVKFALAVKGLT